AALDRQLDDLFAVEVRRIGGKGRTRRVLDAVVDRQDGEIAGTRQAAVIVERLEAAQDPRRAIAGGEDPGDEVRAGQMQLRLRDGFAFVLQQAGGVAAEDRLQLAERGRGCRSHLLLL